MASVPDRPTLTNRSRRSPLHEAASDLERRTRARLASLDAAALTRRPQIPEGVDLCSNDYLGLASHPAVARRMADAARDTGAGATGSRLLRGHRDAFTDLERRFARFKGAERALYFGSGYLANLAVLSTFPDAGDLILSDALNHASLIDGIRLSKADRRILPHLDIHTLASALQAEEERAGHIFVVTESIFSMDGDCAPLDEYAALCREAGASLIVDEAHAVGIFGASGTGLIEERGVARDVLLSIDPCGKALGVAGAFVCGPDWAIEYLVQRARPFIFSTAPPPALAAALDAALDLVESEPQRRTFVRTQARRLRARLREAGFSVAPGDSPIVPVVIGPNEAALEVARALRARGLDVRAIRPPTVPNHTARLRITVTQSLTDAVVEDLVAGLAAAHAHRLPGRA